MDGRRSSPTDPSFRARRVALTRALWQALELAGTSLEALRSGQYTILWTPEMQAHLADGTWTWDQATGGGLQGVLRGAEGKQVVKHLRLEALGPDVKRLLVQVATQAVLADVVQQLDQLQLEVEDLRRALVEDRLAGVEEAERQLEVALAMSDPENRNVALHHAASVAGATFAKLARQVRTSLETPIPKSSPLSQVLRPWSDPHERYRKASAELHLQARGALCAARTWLSALGALGEARAAAVAGREVLTTLRGLRSDRAIDWARHTDPALGLDSWWETDFPVVLRGIDGVVQRLDGRALPVEEIALLPEDP